MRISVIPRLLLHLARSVTLRCPHCRRTNVMRNPYVAHETCAECGLVFQRDEGDFWGTVVLSYGLAGLVGLGTAAIIVRLGMTDWEAVAYIAAGAAVASILLFFPFVKSLWIYLLYFTRGQYEEYRPQKG